MAGNSIEDTGTFPVNVRELGLCWKRLFMIPWGRLSLFRMKRCKENPQICLAWVLSIFALDFYWLYHSVSSDKSVSVSRSRLVTTEESSVRRGQGLFHPIHYRYFNMVHLKSREVQSYISEETDFFPWQRPTICPSSVIMTVPPEVLNVPSL